MEFLMNARRIGPGENQQSLHAAKEGKVGEQREYETILMHVYKRYNLPKSDLLDLQIPPPIEAGLAPVDGLRIARIFSRRRVEFAEFDRRRRYGGLLR